MSSQVNFMPQVQLDTVDPAQLVYFIDYYRQIKFQVDAIWTYLQPRRWWQSPIRHYVVKMAVIITPEPKPHLEFVIGPITEQPRPIVEPLPHLEFLIGPVTEQPRPIVPPLPHLEFLIGPVSEQTGGVLWH